MGETNHDNFNLKKGKEIINVFVCFRLQQEQQQQMVVRQSEHMQLKLQEKMIGLKNMGNNIIQIIENIIENMIGVANQYMRALNSQRLQLDRHTIIQPKPGHDRGIYTKKIYKGRKFNRCTKTLNGELFDKVCKQVKLFDFFFLLLIFQTVGNQTFRLKKRRVFIEKRT